MAIKFSQFVVETSASTMSHIVGYDGADNIQITPNNFFTSFVTGTAGQVPFFGSTTSLLGDAEFNWDNTNKRLGVGITSPIAKLHVYQNNSDDDTTAGVTIEQDGTGDAALSFLLSTVRRWRLGIDNNDLDKFKISSSTNLSTNNKLTIDVDGNVGIGTASPGTTLDVVGTLASSGITQLGTGGSNVLLTSASAGNVGIGTSSPSDKLTIDGNLSIFGNKIYNGSAANSAGVSFPSSTTRIDGYNGITFHSSTTTVGSQSERMRITNNGNVGIGITSPSEKFEVGGPIVWNGPLIASQTSSGVLDRSGDNIRIRAYGASVGSGALQIRTGGGGDQVDTLALTIDASQNATFAGDVTVDSKLNFTGTSYQISGGSSVGDIRFVAPRFRFYEDTISGTAKLQIDGGNATFAGSVIAGGGTPQGASGSILKLSTSSGNTRVSVTSEATSILDFGNQADFDNGGILYDNVNKDMTFKTSANERMRIDSAGNVGIGTTSPTSELHIEASDNPNLKITRGGVDKVLLGDSGSNNGGDLLLYNAGGALTTIIRSGSSSYLNGGNVGIGTTSPDAKLQVRQIADTTANILANGDYGIIIEGNDSGTAGESVGLHLAAKTVGSNPVRGVSILGEVQSTSNDHDMLFATSAGGSAPQERMRIDSSSTTKITSDGTNTAGTILELHFPNNNSTDRCATINLTNNVGGYAVIEGGTTGANNSGYIAFKTDNAGTQGERMRVINNGNVGIGTTTPTAKLTVVGLAEHADNAAAISAGLTTGAFYRTGDLLKVVH